MKHDFLTPLSVLQSMDTIDLSEMKSINLMNRIDTKYIAHQQLLMPLLEMALPHYRVQQIKGEFMNSYSTIYFDTPTSDMYLLHHNRHLQRQKIRIRTYVNSHVSFLEIKNKTNKGRTKKVRTEIDQSKFIDFVTSTKERDFLTLHSAYSPHSLSPHLRTSFDRITLVNSDKTERLTVDLNLRFENFITHQSSELAHLMIIELKQDGLRDSEMKKILQKLRIVPNKISKYCIGTVLTNSKIKNNRFKRKIRMIEKIEMNH
ncbi:MAG TPA: polyphosphate polymerase domain-containing protein [Paludibacteraceae bacterium]|nr:polyphosphate polymerase domain-containing protein [Paludibacteraceae bacterium]